MNNIEEEKQALKDAVEELQTVIQRLNKKLRTTNSNLSITITFESNPSRKIEDCGNLIRILGGIKEEII